MSELWQSCHQRTQAAANAEEAKLLLVGDGPKLKERATYCLPARFASNALERCRGTPNDQATWGSLDTVLRSYAQLYSASSPLSTNRPLLRVVALPRNHTWDQHILGI